MLDQNYSIAEATRTMNVSQSAMDLSIKAGETRLIPQSLVHHAEHIEIRELKRKFQRLEIEKEALKNLNSFSLIEQFRVHYPVISLCQLFGIHRSSYQAWHQRGKQPVAR
ncbi:hypothetical protein [Xenorhabdus bharatensis]|uniref:hypothetical protein n=1 Tax=Xenorhabdus bharatensis TaxID=3136256 RepID=UPI0030F3904A